jgi:hypothetical protein
MKKKMRKFANGGYSTVDPSNPVPSIDDDTRSRAMKSVEGLEGIKGADIADETGMVKGSIKRNEYGDLYDSDMKATKAKPTVAPPKADAPYSKPAGDYVNPEKGLERVEPENYMSPVGVLKGLLKSAAKPFVSAASRVAKNDAAEMAVRNRAANIRGEANDAASTAVRTRAAKVRSEANDAAETAVRTRAAAARGKDNDAASKSVRERANKALEGKKAGGIIRSSASRRADGCALRGKTRA